MSANDAFPGPIPFTGKPRSPAAGALPPTAVDWVALHLAPPDPANPWQPPARTRTATQPARSRDSTAAGAAEFVPCTTAAAALERLTAGEVIRYNRDGYLLRPGGGVPVLAAAELAEQRRLWECAFDAHCEGDPQGVNGRPAAALPPPPPPTNTAARPAHPATVSRRPAHS